jgi:hypothetical protein
MYESLRLRIELVILPEVVTGSYNLQGKQKWRAWDLKK